MDIKNSHRKISRLAGILYIITFVSIPTLGLYKNVKSAHYILSSGSDTAAIIGGISEIIVALAGISTAVVLFPIFKKKNESAALGLVAARILESACIFVGVAFLLTIVTLHRDGAGTDALVTSHALATLYDRIFLLSQSFMPAICDLLIAFLLLKSKLVPNSLCYIGIIGAPLLLISYFSVLLNATTQHSGIAGVAAFPVAIFELSLGIYLLVKGFKPGSVEALCAESD